MTTKPEIAQTNKLTHGRNAFRERSGFQTGLHPRSRAEAFAAITAAVLEKTLRLIKATGFLLEVAEWHERSAPSIYRLTFHDGPLQRSASRCLWAFQCLRWNTMSHRRLSVEMCTALRWSSTPWSRRQVDSNSLHHWRWRKHCCNRTHQDYMSLWMRCWWNSMAEHHSDNIYLQ